MCRNTRSNGYLRRKLVRRRLLKEEELSLFLLNAFEHISEQRSIGSFAGHNLFRRRSSGWIWLQHLLNLRMPLHHNLARPQPLPLGSIGRQHSLRRHFVQDQAQRKDIGCRSLYRLVPQQLRRHVPIVAFFDSGTPHRTGQAKITQHTNIFPKQDIRRLDIHVHQTMGVTSSERLRQVVPDQGQQGMAGQHIPQRDRRTQLRLQTQVPILLPGLPMLQNVRTSLVRRQVLLEKEQSLDVGLSFLDRLQGSLQALNGRVVGRQDLGEGAAAQGSDNVQLREGDGRGVGEKGDELSVVREAGRGAAGSAEGCSGRREDSGSRERHPGQWGGYVLLLGCLVVALGLVRRRLEGRRLHGRLSGLCAHRSSRVGVGATKLAKSLRSVATFVAYFEDTVRYSLVDANRPCGLDTCFLGDSPWCHSAVPQSARDHGIAPRRAGTIGCSPGGYVKWLESRNDPLQALKSPPDHLFQRSGRWKPRYCLLLADATLVCYKTKDDLRPKATYTITSVSDLFVRHRKRNQLLYCLRLGCEAQQDNKQSSLDEPSQAALDDDQSSIDDNLYSALSTDTMPQQLRSQYQREQRESYRKAKRKFLQGTQIAVATGTAVGVTIVTAGIGLVAGLVALGVGSASSGAVFSLGMGDTSTNELVVACLDYDTARRWKVSIEAALEHDTVTQTKWGQMFASDGRQTRAALFPAEVKRKIVDREGQWRPLSCHQQLRIFREEGAALSVDDRPCPACKAQLVLPGRSLDAFLCLMSYGRLVEGAKREPNSEQQSSFRLLERIDDHTDVIHLVCRPLFLFPSWTKPRDFVLYRYWRLEEDGSYCVCYESVQHSDCPPHPNYVRGEMHQVYTVSPLKPKYDPRHLGVSSRAPTECLMTAVVQLDPKGWVPVTPLPFMGDQTYGDAFSIAALTQLLEIRDALDRDRFVQVSVDSDMAPMRTIFQDSLSPAMVQRSRSIDSVEEHDPRSYDFAFANRESLLSEDSATGIASHPPPLPPEKWAEPDANSFRVRGPNYLTDKKKDNAGDSIGRLIAVDLVHVDKPIYTGMTTHPTERLQLALKREQSLKDKGVDSDLPPFIFVMNIILPGPPFYHGVYYFAIDDISTIDGTNGSPSSKLCNKFFFGDSDAFRDKTFKLIPQIVEGNFVVRKAVGSTPAIMGKKLRQLYVRTERSFEILVDCGSNAVATGVIRLSLGYAKSLVVDMGFLFEGAEEDVLPERIFGCVRMKRPDFGPTSIRHVDQPPTDA